MSRKTEKLWLSENLVWETNAESKKRLDVETELLTLIYSTSKETSKKTYYNLVNELTIQGSLLTNSYSALRLFSMLQHKITNESRGYILDLIQDMFVNEGHGDTQHFEQLQLCLISFFAYFSYYLQYGNLLEQEIIILLLAYCSDYDSNLVSEVKKLYDKFELQHPESDLLELIDDCRNDF